MIGHCCTTISLKRVLATATSTFEKRNSATEMVRTALAIGLIKSPQVVICEKKYVNSLVFSKYFVQLFSSEHYVYFNICASAIDNRSIRLNPNVV